MINWVNIRVLAEGKVFCILYMDINLKLAIFTAPYNKSVVFNWSLF